MHTSSWIPFKQAYCNQTSSLGFPISDPNIQGLQCRTCSPSIVVERMERRFDKQIPATQQVRKQAKLWREGATLTTRTALPTTSAVLRKDDCCKQPTSRWTALLCEGFSMPVVKVFQCLSSVADRSRGTTHQSWDLWEGIERGTRLGSFRNVGLARFSQLCDSWSRSLISTWLTKLCLEVWRLNFGIVNVPNTTWKEALMHRISFKTWCAANLSGS